MRKHKRILAIALAAGLSIAASGAVSAQQGNMGPGMMGYGQGGTGPGMMGYGQGGMGPGMMGYGQGGMGPGMMGYGQGGMGPGMMGYGQGGMGPGMMGYGQGGMGPGMMGYGRGGMGPGMMGYGRGGMGPCVMGYEMIQGLDAEQRSQMRELMQQHRPAQFERMGKMMDLRMELVAAMEADTPDAEQIRSLYGQMGELQGEMMAEMTRMRGRMFDLLTDEQRKQLQQGVGSPGSSQ